MLCLPSREPGFVNPGATVEVNELLPKTSTRGFTFLPGSVLRIGSLKSLGLTKGGASAGAVPARSFYFPVF